MRTLVVVALVLLPLVAGAGTDPECRKLTKQIAHFEDVVEMAQERDNALWEAETRRHIERLEQRRSQRCPEPVLVDGTAAELKAMFKKAAKAAATYFMPGL